MQLKQNMISNSSELQVKYLEWDGPQARISQLSKLALYWFSISQEGWLHQNQSDPHDTDSERNLLKLLQLEQIEYCQQIWKKQNFIESLASN